MPDPVPAQLEKVDEASRKLRQLLDDPHPGLSTWWFAVADCMRDLKAEAIIAGI